MTMRTLRDLLTDSSVHVLDGAMGTMLYSRGVFVNVCYDELNLKQPGLVQEVHEAYVRAGAEILETNTFGANPVKLSAFGLEERTEEINRAAAVLALRAARGRAARGGCDRSARSTDRAVGTDVPGRGGRPFHPTGPRPRRGRRGRVHPGDVQRSRGAARRVSRITLGDRRPDHRPDDGSRGRQHLLRDLGGDDRRALGGVGRGRRGPQLLGRPGAHAGSDRAHGRGDEPAALRPAQRRPAPRRRRPPDLPRESRLHGAVCPPPDSVRREAHRRLLRHHARAHPADPGVRSGHSAATGDGGTAHRARASGGGCRAGSAGGALRLGPQAGRRQVRPKRRGRASPRMEPVADAGALPDASRSGRGRREHRRMAPGRRAAWACFPRR